MTDTSELNQVIIDTIAENCNNNDVLYLIYDSLMYELDIWNRRLLQSEIDGQYQLILEKIIRGESK